MKRDKRGQFYLLVAVIIVAIIIGFASINNLLQKNPGIRLEETGEELDFESGQVLEFGVSNVEDNEMENLIDYFTTVYAGYVGDEKEIIFIIGDSSGLEDAAVDTVVSGEGASLKAFTYKELVAGKISLIVSENALTVETTKRATESFEITKISDNEISVAVEDQNYVFEIKPGENFYFVISQTVGDEEYIVTSD